MQTDPNIIELRPHQRAAVTFWQQRNGRVLLAHEMGTGKTFSAAAIGEELDRSKDNTAGVLRDETYRARILIVCPEMLRFNWKRELMRFVPEHRRSHVYVYGFDENASKAWVMSGGYLIVGYHKFIDIAEALAKDYTPDLLIADECHYVKNRKAQRTKAMRTVARRVEFCVFLSGTPLVNRPVELFPILNMIDPTTWDNFIKFGYRYCNAVRTRFGWDFSGATRLEELHGKLTAGCMHRVLKVDVLKDLPAKSRSVVPLELSNRDTYDKLINAATGSIIDWVNCENLPQQTMISALTQINALRQACVAGKMKAVKDWIKDFLEAGDEPLVIFGHHKNVLNELWNFIAHDCNVPCDVIDGDVPPAWCDARIEAFQKGERRVLLCSLMKAGVGVTLTRAAHVAFIEVDWVPGVMLQAEDRLHRMGQIHPVMCYYLVARDTIDQSLVEIITQKQTIIERVLEGRGSQSRNQSVFHEVLRALVPADQKAGWEGDV